METIIVGDSGVLVRGGDTCWRCGKKSPDVKITVHHGIPQTMMPKRNAEIPICEGCHDEMNKQDVNSTLQFVYKLVKNSEELVKVGEDLLGASRKAASMIENQTFIKFKERIHK